MIYCNKTGKGAAIVKETTKRVILILSFALILAALAVMLPLLFRKGMTNL